MLTIFLGPSPYILIQFGFFVAWAYLRFFKLSENGDFRGDRSETFAFANWFPPFIRCVGRVADPGAHTDEVVAAPANTSPSLAITSLPCVCDSKLCSPGTTRATVEPTRCFLDPARPVPKPSGEGATKVRLVHTSLTNSLDRRALALKALDARMASAPPAVTTPAPVPTASAGAAAGVSVSDEAKPENDAVGRADAGPME